MISIIYLAFTIVICVMYGVKIKKLEERIEQIETFLCRDEEWLENEVDD